MTTATRTHAVLVARMRDGSIAFKCRLKDRDLTTRRNFAWVMTVDEAYETQQRLHAVQALGHYWQDVSFFDVCRVKNKTASR